MGLKYLVAKKGAIVAHCCDIDVSMLGLKFSSMNTMSFLYSACVFLSPGLCFALRIRIERNSTRSASPHGHFKNMPRSSAFRELIVLRKAVNDVCFTGPAARIALNPSVHWKKKGSVCEDCDGCYFQSGKRYGIQREGRFPFLARGRRQWRISRDGVRQHVHWHTVRQSCRSARHAESRGRALPRGRFRERMRRYTAIFGAVLCRQNWHGRLLRKVMRASSRGGGIETTIIILGAYTSGLNHVAHAAAFVDAAVVMEYDGGPTQR